MDLLWTLQYLFSVINDLCKNEKISYFPNEDEFESFISCFKLQIFSIRQIKWPTPNFASHMPWWVIQTLFISGQGCPTHKIATIYSFKQPRGELSFSNVLYKNKLSSGFIYFLVLLIVQHCFRVSKKCNIW